MTEFARQIEPAAAVDALRALAVAQRRLAEDAVSECLLSPRWSAADLRRALALRTWLVGILKHKLVDQLRRHTREATVLVGDDGEDLDDLLFRPTATGATRRARPWGDRTPPAAAGSSSRCCRPASTCRQAGARVHDARVAQSTPTRSAANSPTRATCGCCCTAPAAPARVPAAALFDSATAGSARTCR